MPESGNTMFIRSNGISAEGIRDQYADGKAAKVWEIFIGDKKSRTENYKNFLVDLLRERGCKRILDVACGTGWDLDLIIAMNMFKNVFLWLQGWLNYAAWRRFWCW